MVGVDAGGDVECFVVGVGGRHGRSCCVWIAVDNHMATYPKWCAEISEKISDFLIGTPHMCLTGT